MKTSSTSGKTIAFERECIQLFSEVVILFGVPKSVGQIYGLLYASMRPLSFSDVVERLEISKGSASQGLQLLRALGAIRPVSRLERTVARDYYELELALRRLLDGILREKIAPFVKNGRSRMGRLRELAKANQDSEDREFQLKRVEQLETWRHQMTLATPLLKGLLAIPIGD